MADSRSDEVRAEVAEVKNALGWSFGEWYWQAHHRIYRGDPVVMQWARRYVELAKEMMKRPARLVAFMNGAADVLPLAAPPDQSIQGEGHSG